MEGSPAHAGVHPRRLARRGGASAGARLHRDDLGRHRRDARVLHHLGRRGARILTPGAHILIATTPVLSHHVYGPLLALGFEKRGEVVRLVQTLRGGDRPKNAEADFPGVTVMPRGGWEAWGVLRKPLDGRVQDTLRRWGTGGLRRESASRPFTDVIASGPVRGKERAISSHPSMKPQKFMRQIVRASLPLGTGIVLDPFMGSGATIAAAQAVGYNAIGIEPDQMFFAEAVRGIPELAVIA